jgi:mannose-6-phosphate isomerase class I
MAQFQSSASSYRGKIMPTTYDKHPFVDTGFASELCFCGWDQIAAELLSRKEAEDFIVCIECYPGTLDTEIAEALELLLRPTLVIHAAEAYRSSSELRQTFDRGLTDDPVFGRISDARIDDFFDPDLRKALTAHVRGAHGIVLILGAGASLLAPKTACLIYADMARWEIQLRQRKNLVGNLGLSNLNDRAAEKYKRAFFLDWRAADRLKCELLPAANYVLDTNVAEAPKMISGVTFRTSLEHAVQRPIRLVPFFDPGPWGGQWMREKFDLPDEPANFAWCFDCVPEENSLLLGFGEHRFETPAQNLVLLQPDKLMGKAVYARFGMDFPIRFDLLDTMGGGNLSLQVHPMTDYIHANFGMNYTQDESYYLLDAGSDATVYLGLKTGVNPAEMEFDLRRAQKTDFEFPVEKYANRIPAKKHDHFLIPAGTLHCSGANSMVLEISATPYIFTFKLWDWGRLGLDGRPRPVHLDHGLKNIQWERETTWTNDQLVNTVTSVAEGIGWREERTGLHAQEFIETRRHWFNQVVEHDTCGGVHVLNLVEGSEVVVESPEKKFDPFVVHYAETFLVPAQVSRYTITPTCSGELCATIRASVRTSTVGPTPPGR